VNHFLARHNDGTLTKINKMAKIKKKLTAAQRDARKIAKAEEQNIYTWVFMNGKQVKVKRPPTVLIVEIDSDCKQTAHPPYSSSDHGDVYDWMYSFAQPACSRTVLGKTL